MTAEPTTAERRVAWRALWRHLLAAPPPEPEVKPVLQVVNGEASANTPPSKAGSP